MEKNLQQQKLLKHTSQIKNHEHLKLSTIVEIIKAYQPKQKFNKD